VRGAKGRIRRIHGDLHLGNIVLLEGRPVLFDAIEFSPLIATGDVLYDLAFPLMDLLNSGLAACANVVLNRYHAETRRPDDLDALAGLPLFMSIRAQIRANVGAAQLALAPKARHGSIKDAARSYFDLARRLIAPPAPILVAVGGLSGTGKSALARVLAPDLGAAPGAVVLRSDVERKALFGCSETEPLPQSAYTAAVTAKVYETLAEKARRIVTAGHSVVIDAVFAAPTERAAIEAVARASRVPFRGLFLSADLATRLGRLKRRSRDASDADAAVARQQESYDLGRMDWTRVDASGPPEQTVKNAEVANWSSHPSV
jgi:predicted kinase